MKIILSAHTAQALSAGPVSAAIGFRGFRPSTTIKIIPLRVLSINDNLNRMREVLQIAKFHPVSTISYILYTLFCFIGIDYIIKFNAAFENTQPGQQVNWGGQGELFAVIFTFLFAIIFIAVMILNALLRKTKQSFYWWMCLFIAIPFFILIGVVYLLNAN